MKLTQDFLVGALFFFGIILVGIFTIVIKDLPTLEGNRGKLSVIFDRVSGLEKGHKVLASGMEVGQVSDLQLLDDGSVKVGINLTHPVKLYKDYKIAVRDASALGGKYVNIDLGTPEEGILKVSPLGYQETKKRPFSGSTQPSLLDDPNLREAFVSLKNIARKIDKGQGTIGLLINERKIYDDIEKAADNIQHITKQMRSSTNTIGKLLNDTKLYDQISNIATNIEQITDTIRSGKGTIGRLVNEETIYNDARDAIKNAKKMMANIADITDQVKAGKGTIGKLFTDEKVYNELEKALIDARRMMNNIDKVAQGIHSGEGTLGVLLQDKGMAKDLQATLANIRVITSRLKKGEGTVGKLLADDTLYKEIRRVVKGMSDAIEDTREQVPISTFTSILFKAF